MDNINNKYTYLIIFLNLIAIMISFVIWGMELQAFLSSIISNIIIPSVVLNIKKKQDAKYYKEWKKNNDIYVGIKLPTNEVISKSIKLNEVVNYFNQSNIFLCEKNYEAALNCIKKAIEIKENPYLIFRLCYLLELSNNINGAISNSKVLRKKIKGKKDYYKDIRIENALFLNRLLKFRGNYENAISILKEELSFTNEKSDEYYLLENELGDCLIEIGKFEEGIEKYLNILEEYKSKEMFLKIIDKIVFQVLSYSENNKNILFKYIEKLAESEWIKNTKNIEVYILIYKIIKKINIYSLEKLKKDIMKLDENKKRHLINIINKKNGFKVVNGNWEETIDKYLKEVESEYINTLNNLFEQYKSEIEGIFLREIDQLDEFNNIQGRNE